MRIATSRHPRSPTPMRLDTRRSMPGETAGAVTSAGDHLIAIGHLLKQSGLRAGGRALEYGAGFGQLALTLARLGVEVDTVDINPMFNDAVQAQAEHFGVPLHAFHGEFGLNPRPDSRYDAILFYESFHHCADAPALLDKLRGFLAANGVVMMAGEPIQGETPLLPYPWGIRLDAETVAVMRWRRWLELGYQETFLARMAIQNGFIWSKCPCALTHYGEIHVLRPRPDRIGLSTLVIPDSEAEGWHGVEAEGRWTNGQAIMPIDSTTSYNSISVCIENHHPSAIDYWIGCGVWRLSGRLAGAATEVLAVPKVPDARDITINSTTIVPAQLWL